MPSYGGPAVMRDDYRCLLCRQKDAFHCEHDTPYRDKFLVDKELERAQNTSNSGSKQNQTSQRTQQNPTSTAKLTTQQNPNSTAKPTTNNATAVRKMTTKNQQVTSTTNAPVTTNQKPNDQKNKKSCVIL